jgi:hypothetical protein
MKTSKTTYRVIGFGTNEHGFFNQFAFCGSIGYARGFYEGHLQDPEMDGAVVIRVNHETWEVEAEFGTEDMAVVYGPVGNFKVEPAPKIVLVK